MNVLLDIALTNAAIATLLALGVAFVTWRFRLRPAVRHALWLLVLIKLIAPPLVPIRVEFPSKAAPVATTERIVEEVADLGVWTETRIAESDLSPSDVVVWREPVGVAGPKGTPVAPIERHPNGATGVPIGPATRSISWRGVVAAVWLTGSVVWLSVALIRILRFHRVLRHAKPASESIREHVDDVAAHIGLRRVPQVVMTSGAVSPLVWGFGTVPKLVIPTGLWARLDQEQRTTLLIHELAHLRRGDHLVRLLELVVTALYWWHPVVWLARRALRDAEEQCCDAWVVWAEPKAARSYATALLETVEFLSRSPGQPFAAPAAATGLGRVDHLKRRLTMILRGTTPRRLSLSGALAILGLAGVLLPLAPIAAQEEEKPKEAVRQYIERLDIVPTLVGDVKIEEGKSVSNSVDVFARTAPQDEGADAKPKPEDDPTIAKEKADLDSQVEGLQEAQKNKAEELAKLAAELNGLRQRQAQVIQRMRELEGKGAADVVRGTPLLPPDQDGSMIIFRRDGGRPGSQTIVRKLRVNPDGVPTLITEDIVGSADGKPIGVSVEEQAQREQEAAVRKDLEAAARILKGKSSDPTLKHHRKKLAEIQAQLRAIQASKPNPDKQTAEESIRQAESELAKALDRLEWSNRMAKIGYVSASQNQSDKLAMDKARDTLQVQRIDALEKKLDSVLDELKRLKSGETEKDKPGPGF